MITTLSAGKRLADDEAARLLDAANGQVNEGGGDVSEQLIVGNVVPATGEIRTTEGQDWYSEAAKWLKQWDESGATMQSLEEIRGTDALAALWNSTAEFHERFDTIHDKEHPFIPAQYRAFMEEVAEFSIEVLGSEEFGGDVEAIERELTDVIVVGMGLLMAHGRNLEDLRAAMRHVAEGNDAKTTDKYAKNAKGKVARKTA